MYPFIEDLARERQKELLAEAERARLVAQLKPASVGPRRNAVRDIAAALVRNVVSPLRRRVLVAAREQ